MVLTRLQSTTGGDNEGSTMALRHGIGPQVSYDLTPSTSHSFSPNLSQPYVSTTHFLDMPSECMEKIFSSLGYKQVSKLRLVCRQLDSVCSVLLNSTFQKLQTQMLHRFQVIKAKMPRRESARRNHPLACESDIIETLHMRLTLLQMSFGKHIDRKHICFFAGEILDEVYRILHYIKVTPKLARPYKIVDELSDLSTMAMEYFKEHIEPSLPEIAYFGTDFVDFSATSNKYLSLNSPPLGIGKCDKSFSTTKSDGRKAPQQRNMVLQKGILKIKQGMKRYNYQLGQMRKELRCCRGKIANQQKQILEYASRLDEYDKKTEETNRKFSTMLQELNKCKTELQYWQSKLPLTSMCGGCGQVGGPLIDQSNLKDPTNQAVLVPEPEPVFPGPSTFSVVWLSDILPEQNFPEQRNKRKCSVGERSTPASGTPPAKKCNVLKSRTKR